jgi:Ca2+-binding RTX toxin-like protein
VINGTGNGLANLIIGNDAANVLNGAAGADTLAGGLGNDVYIVDNAGDVVLENPVAGTDTINSAVSYSLLDAPNVENLVLSGNGAINGTGNALNNILNGNSAANTLDGGVGADAMSGGAGNDTLAGGAGNDILKGGLGNDVLSGGAGADSFFFAEAPGAANSDVISDFTSGADKLRLDDAFFTGIGTLGGFAPNDARFHAAAGATGGADASDRVVYDTSTGNLYYDADGSGLGVAQLFATLDLHPQLAAQDFVVI